MNTSHFIDFVRSIYKTDGFIPLHEPSFNGNEKKYVLDTIDSTFVSSVGEYVTRFEKDFAEFVGSKYAIAVVNGTAALHLALLATGVKKDHEVITQPLTFVATCNAIAYCGAEPVFVDVDNNTLGLSSYSLRKFLEENTYQENNQCFNRSSNRIIKACVPMHTFGHACRIDEIKKICDQHNIVLIEDAAEALGSSYKNKHLGTFGKVSAFSFNGNKIMTTGGGGMIVTDDEELSVRCKFLSTTAKEAHKWEYFHPELAYNYRMPNLNAALGCAQLEKLPEFLREKRELAASYQKNFPNSFKEPDHSRSNFWLNALSLDNENQKIEFLRLTNESGIMTRPIWSLMTNLPMYSHCQKTDLSNAEKLAKTIVNIPSSVPKKLGAPQSSAAIQDLIMTKADLK